MFARRLKDYARALYEGEIYQAFMIYANLVHMRCPSGYITLVEENHHRKEFLN